MGRRRPVIEVSSYSLNQEYEASITNTLIFQPECFFHAAAASKSLQSCVTLSDTIDRSPPRSPVPGILQARILEWVAISFSNAWKWKVTVKSLSLAQVLATPWTGAYQAPPSMGFSRQEYWSGAFSRSCNSFVLSFFPLLWKFLTWIW